MTNWREKYTIGSQWKCRDGSRAIIVHECGKVYNITHGDLHFIVEDGLFNRHEKNGLDLIEPWTEPRVFEDEVFVLENGAMFNKKSFEMYLVANDLEDTIPVNFLNLSIKAQQRGRKKITITEGEGL